MKTALLLEQIMTENEMELFLGRMDIPLFDDDDDEMIIDSTIVIDEAIAMGYVPVINHKSQTMYFVEKASASKEVRLALANLTFHVKERATELIQKN